MRLPPFFLVFIIGSSLDKSLLYGKFLYFLKNVIKKRNIIENKIVGIIFE
jgi:hypothetical protein